MIRMVLPGLVLLHLTSVLYAQPQNINLKGYLAVEGGESFTYNIVFTDSAGIIKGCAYTYTEEKKDVKATITGELNREKNTLSFKETAIIYNHGFESKTILCLIDAQLKYTLKNNTYVLGGPINSHDAANAYCGTGTITFIENETLKALFNKTEKKDSLPVAKKKPVEKRVPPYGPSRPVVVENINPKPEMGIVADEITKGVEKVYEWKTDTIVVAIWDGGNIDGDIVSLMFNKQTLLDHYTLQAKKKKLFIPLSGKETDILTIVADNEGNEPPNTANILLTDGDKQYNIIAYNSVGQEAVIRIRKAKK